MELVKQNRDCAVKVADQLHIHLPPNAFTNEASNFWAGAIIGAGVLLVLLANLANTR